MPRGKFSLDPHPALAYLPATLGRTDGCGKPIDQSRLVGRACIWSARCSGEGVSAGRSVTKLARMPAEELEAAGRTRHGAQGCAPHRPIAPGIHGVRSPPRTRCFRGLFLRADRIDGS